MNDTLKAILKPFASLRLTVALLALSMVVVFAGTWAQIDQDIWAVQQKFFHSFFTIIDFRLFLPRQEPNWSQMSAPIAAIAGAFLALFRVLRVPMLGGYSLIILLLFNLLAAHSVRFKFNRKRVGILLIHAGLILLIVGEVVTSVFAIEQRMTIWQGKSANWAADFRYVELAVIDPTPADQNSVAIIPGSRLRDGAVITDPKLPLSIQIDRFYRNSVALEPVAAKRMNFTPEINATAGELAKKVLIKLPEVKGTDSDQIDMPGAYVTILDSNGKPQTYLLTSDPSFDQPQDIQLGDKAYQISLRFKRYYKPFTIHLAKFTHEVYTGSDTPKNFASEIRLVDPSRNVDREAKIWMNHPMRYAGETFYQAGFDEAQDRYTVLQVVDNPGWLIPYISCSMVALGMLIHFGGHLLEFLRKNRAAAAVVAPAGKKSPAKGKPALAGPRPGLLWPAIVTASCVVYLFSLGSPPKQHGPFDLRAFGAVPISYEGRVMPLDSLAQNTLRIISGKDHVLLDDPEIVQSSFARMFNIPRGVQQPATWWLLNVMAKPHEARSFPVFRIDHPDILNLLELSPNRTLFSLNEILAHEDRLHSEINKLRDVPQNERDLYQKKFAEFVDHLNLYVALEQISGLYLAPPTLENSDWITVKEADEAAKATNHPNPGIVALGNLLDSYANNHPAEFSQAASEYANWFDGRLPSDAMRVNFETIFNSVEPFTAAMALYVLVFLLICFSWMGWSATLTRTAFWVLIVTLAFHTLALIARIYIQNRPPVTNLYSSAIFIGWAVGIMCVCLELIYRNGIGTMLAAVMGFLTLILAHHLATTSEHGDTMQMMRAVLDTNFWLATHVVVIVLGYSATLLAGFLAIIYVLRGLLTRSLAGENAKVIYRMVYGILCFAMLFSFVGTILGGIWADQSWGRFWGWDPKENGAVLIVLWNALILHARWGGLVQARGVMNLAIFGNVVTSWSYFGTNMLGVGLHSYGFMDSAVFWLVLFMVVQLGLIGLGSLPLKWWRSFAQPPSNRALSAQTAA